MAILSENVLPSVYIQPGFLIHELNNNLMQDFLMLHLPDATVCVMAVCVCIDGERKIVKSLHW